MKCLFRENKERIKYFQNVETTRTKAFRTHSEIYDGAFLRKEKMLESRDFHKKAPSYMSNRVLNTPPVSNLVFSLLGHSVKQNYWRGIRPYYKGFRDF